MELYEAMRTTFSAREYTHDLVSDEVLYKILDNARFAPSGGNRQGWKVIIVRKKETKEKIAELAIPGAKKYAAQRIAGENPWNTVDPCKVSEQEIENTPPSPKLHMTYVDAPVVLVVCIDLKVVAAMDQHLDRIGLVSGASIYPFVWNILLAARNEGFGGRITTIPISKEPEIQDFLKIPNHIAIAAIMPMGKPVKQITKLSRKPVSEIAYLETWEGEKLK
ncbi:MAG: nitroreductase family protein [Candidatus Dadabacteria bacterium]|nr:nitroreductase family protein [Candidatus Dadabacteria bacterium]NIS08986.1 nitroreductase family protein [Candidatus Dadabacteria bacterium]NIV41029.1 nitroreductase [Candidatus Dadabacteria bacterium]NIX15588.1 nitroreductase [Candidatus Dadabacteria bacterium]NIY22329.1 nitroreductase [Candidatus Dadabacteria bacterium]